MATRYWVGGGSSANWNATEDTNWGTASGVRDNASVPGASDDVIFDNHANGDTPCTLSANTTIKSLVMTGWANTLTHNDDVTLTVEGTVTLASDMTYTANATNTRITMTETATLTTAGIVLSRLTFSGSDKTITLGDNLTLAGSGSDTLVLSSDTEFTHNDKKVTLTGDSPRINGTFTFYDLTIEGNNSSTAKVELTQNITVDNTLKIDGYSAKNRVEVRSSTGVQRTITAAEVSVSNIAVYGIKGAGDGNWDLSAVTGGSADLGGNSDITFTTATTWYWHEGTGNWSDYSKWYTATNGGGTQMAEARTPLPQDTCIFDSDSFDSSGRVVTNDMILTPAFDFSDATNSPELILQQNSYLYGSVTLCSDMTFTGPTGNVYIVQRDKNISITCAGVGFPCSVIVSTIGRTVTFNDDFILPDDRGLDLANGTITTDNDVTVGRVRRYGGVLDMGDAVLNMGSGTWYLATFWNMWDPTASVTVNCGTSTVKINNNSASVWPGFWGGGHTYYNLWLYHSEEYITIRTSSTFNNIKIEAGEEVRFFEESTQTTNTFTAEGSVGNLITLKSSSTTKANLTKSGGGTIEVKYCDISYLNATPEDTWIAYASEGNIDSGNNTGWDFGIVTEVIEKDLDYFIVTQDKNEKDLEYSVRNKIKTEKSLNYLVASYNSQEKDLNYFIVTQDKNEKDLNYNVLLTDSQEKDLNYNIIASDIKQRDLEYIIKTTKAEQKDLEYQVKLVNEEVKDLKYTVIDDNKQEKDLEYLILTTDKNEKDLNYNLNLTKKIDKDLDYSVKSQQEELRDLNYLVITKGLEQKDLTYEIADISTIKIEKDLSYKILDENIEQKDLNYEIVSQQKEEKDLQYTVIDTNDTQKDLDYHIVITKDQQKDLNYKVSKTELVSKDLQYTVKSDTTKQRSLLYIVASETTEIRLLSYNIRLRKSNQKDLDYLIKTTGLKTKDLQYSLYIEFEYPYSDKPSPYMPYKKKRC